MNVAALSRRAVGLSTAFAPAHDHHSISFDSGHAYPDLLPDLTQFAQTALTRYRTETLQYAGRQGLSDLRHWLSKFMAEDGARVSPDEILVVNGAKQGIDLVCRLLLDEGDSIVVTAPTYFTALPIFRSFGVEFIEISQDKEGMDVGVLERTLRLLESEGKKAPKFIYNVPDFHNPTGGTMSADRRRALLKLAAAHGIYVVEDSPYRKVRFEGGSEPSLKSLDTEGVVFLIGTFAKLVAPGLRIGWIAGPKEMLARIAQLKSDGGSCPLTQRLIFEFCNSKQFAEHLEKVRDRYARNRDRMVKALRREMPEARFSIPEGGYYVWLTLPPEIDGDLLAERGAKEGVTVIAGSRFYPTHTLYPKNQGSPKNHLRLAYSYATPEEIDEGVARLARAYRSVAPASPQRLPPAAK